jgi:hypothetical protein
LAHSAASNTAALMLARASGHQPRPTPRGEVFRVETPRLEPGLGTARDLSHDWVSARHRVEDALAEGRVVAAVGEAGSGRATLLAQAERRHHPSARILAASPPAPTDIEAWLSLWSPEVGKPHTAVIVRHVDSLPLWVAEQLRELVSGVLARTAGADSSPVPVTFTAERFEDIPPSLAGLVDTVVHVPPLRERVDDVVPLARQIAHRARGRSIDIAAAAQHALENYAWPGNVAELHDLVRNAALHADVIELRDLPPHVLAGSSRKLSRIEAFERDEIIRVLTRTEITMRDAAEELGMSRATLYRKLAQYDIHLGHSRA